ncbi:tyrosine-type recombinase/integrase [Cryptosporangium sp. NPDC048952]|uniref:tyrosine-type recombinase/integrase n=1 Tax=Cryptosporangium sp. NPDC048952 TaxID=3363961 RepID=UPI003719B90D
MTPAAPTAGGSSSFQVRFRDLQYVKGPRDKTGRWRVRWTVGGSGNEKTASFKHKVPADRYLSQLKSALNNGEPFDLVTGLPARLARARESVTWFAHAQDYARMRWARSAPTDRRSRAEGLTTITLALLTPRRSGAPDPAITRRALLHYAFRPVQAWTDPPAPQITAALAWIEKHSLPVHALSQPATVRHVLDACAVKLDGTPAAASTLSRKRATLSQTCRYAIERGLLTTPPLQLVRWRPPETAQTLDRRTVPSPQQVTALLAAVGAQGPHAERLVAFFATLYYAALRPSEAVRLEIGDCDLPDTGWERLTLTGAEPKAGSAWTDTGRPRQARGLKRRAATETRTVPIPPVLVAILRNHLKEYGGGPDDRVFTNMRGNPLQDTGYNRVWHRARTTALTPAEAASPLARRPYDLRHAGITIWITHGLPITEAARRAGQGVQVLMRVYAGWIQGQYSSAETAIGEAFATQSPLAG